MSIIITPPATTTTLPVSTESYSKLTHFPNLSTELNTTTHHIVSEYLRNTDYLNQYITTNNIYISHKHQLSIKQTTVYVLIIRISNIEQFLINQLNMQPNYQQNFSNQRAPNNAVLINSGLTDREGAKNVARRILDTYDRDRNGVIDSIEVVPMIVDAYKSFNRVFSPSRADIESYLKVLDRNGDGRVTIQDLEELCAKYLTAKI